MLLESASAIAEQNFIHFRNGCLDRFKNRNKLNCSKAYGESADVEYAVAEAKLLSCGVSPQHMA